MKFPTRRNFSASFHETENVESVCEILGTVVNELA